MIQFTAKRMFFDSRPVIRATDAATRRVLSRFGSFVRQRARTSIRPRRGYSRPGQPPHSHTGLLRRFIFFGYDLARRSVVIGPQALHRQPEAPELLEYGGTARRTRFRGDRPHRVRYAARPYMGPAFEAEKPKLPALWANSIRT